MCVFIFVKRFLYTFRPSGAFSGSMSVFYTPFAPLGLDIFTETQPTRNLCVSTRILYTPFKINI